MSSNLAAKLASVRGDISRVHGELRQHHHAYVAHHLKTQKVTPVPKLPSIIELSALFTVAREMALTCRKQLRSSRK